MFMRVTSLLSITQALSQARSQPFERLGSRQSEPRRLIIGGTTVDPPFSYPWVCSLETSSHSCVGTLISLEWVLTAAHCIGALSAANFAVHVHRHNIANAPLQDDPTCSNNIAVTEVRVHPDWNPGADSSTWQYDIALLKLARVPTCVHTWQLPSLDTGTYSTGGTQAMVAGWGRVVEGGHRNGLLQHAFLPVLDNGSPSEEGSCNWMLAAYNSVVDDSQMCTYESGKDPCDGDSGGGLMHIKADGGSVVLGIVSYGHGCGRHNSPGVYTRVSYFKPWIEEVMALPPPSPPVPPVPPPQPPVFAVCRELCTYGTQWITSDGYCDDGGQGANYATCAEGNDCADCGVRVIGSGCLNTCSSAGNAACDDGGPGATAGSCMFGTDCQDW